MTTLYNASCAFLKETHRAGTSVAVGSIEQNELIVEVHKAQASVAVISN